MAKKYFIAKAFLKLRRVLESSYSIAVFKKATVLLEET
jgi:hypothetical protein